MASSQSTQNTQYDKIGTKYNAIKVLPSVEPEEPSVTKALGSIEGKTCLGTYRFSYCQDLMLFRRAECDNERLQMRTESIEQSRTTTLTHT